MHWTNCTVFLKEDTSLPQEDVPVRRKTKNFTHRCSDFIPRRFTADGGDFCTQMKMMLRRGLAYCFTFHLVYLFLFFTPLPAPALDPQKAVTQYKLDIWQAERGFEQNSINAIVQTRDGYIWIGTQDGLVRFDGIRFNVFNKNNTGELSSNAVRALYEDRNGVLWIGMDGGLSSLLKGKFTTYTTKDCPVLESISALTRDPGGNLWIGSDGKGAARFKDGTFTAYTKDSTGGGLINDGIQGIRADKYGNLWFATVGGLVKRTPAGTFIDYTGKSGMFSDYIYCILEKENGELWVGGYPGLFMKKGETFHYYGIENGLPNPKIVSLLEDGSRNFWVGTDGSGLARLKNGNFQRFSLEHGMACGYVRALCEDREGSLWMGTLKGGLHRLRDTIFITYTTMEGLTDSHINGIYENRAGVLWVGTQNGLNRMEQGRVTLKLTVKNGLLNRVIHSVLEDNSGTTWIGTDGGLSRYSGGKLTNFTMKNGLLHDHVYTLFEDSRGYLWIGGLKGLSRFHHGQLMPFDAKEEFVAKCILEDGKGNLWIGTESGLKHLENGHLRSYTTRDGLAHNHIECLYEDKDGTLFIGTRGGLNRLKDDTFTAFTIRGGLNDNRVNYIVEDDTGNVWLAGIAGISRIGKKGLMDFFDGKVEKIYPVTYTELDGMKTRRCNNAGVKSRDGGLWFATHNGLVNIDPSNIKINPPPPPVIIEELKVDGEDIVLNGRYSSKENPLVIPPGKERLDFYYTALSFIKPQKVAFKLKLEGYDDHWIDHGNARGTTYTRLAPGHYTFKVIARNSDGIWNRAGASLYFHMQPYFWQTTWFIIAAALFVIFAVVSGYRFHVKQLKDREKRLSKLVELRTRALNDRTIELEKAHGSLQISKGIIEKKNQNILASINYAQKIQQAVLPNTEKIRKVLNDSFIIFKPRDIVSGDFYWFSHLDDRVFIAAVDCTGHGVPGAFLSMIGNITLNEIVKEVQITNPGQILCRLHRGVRSVLHQEKEGYKTGDGMEVGMCMIDLENGKLTFAGAKRPLFYVKNSEFFEIKGDRRAIGGRQKEKRRVFTNHEIGIQSETIIYLTTDGFVDQHNGENKKYGSLRFKKLLQDNAHLPMEQQKEVIIRELTDHRGNENQRDDITVIGIKIRGKE